MISVLYSVIIGSKDLSCESTGHCLIFCSRRRGAGTVSVAIVGWVRGSEKLCLWV